MKQKGFTLLEMLLVLFAISVLSIVTYFNVQSLYERQKIEQFLRQFSNDILYMQQLAINRQKHYTLRWHKEKNMYYIRESGTKHFIVKRDYDNDMQIDLHTFPNPMTYNPSGNINRGGTILLSYRNYKYEIVFQLGRGRFTYREMPKRVDNGGNACGIKFINDGGIVTTTANSIGYARKKKYTNPL